MEKREKLVYTIKEVMIMQDCSYPKAANIIAHLNKKLEKLGVPKEALKEVTVSIKFYHEELRI